MNFIERQIENIFDPRGKLANGLEGFEVRPSQVEMAQLIAKALEKEIFAIIEAGTGTSKTFGYVDVVMMKGRRNYLCLYKYHRLTIQPSLLEGVDQERNQHY